MVGQRKYPEPQYRDRNRDFYKARNRALSTSASLMSTTKWIKFFLILDQCADVEFCRVKFLNVVEPTALTDCPVSSQLYPRNWLDWGSPFLLSDIEWIEFPRLAVLKPNKHWPAKEFPQNIDALERRLARVGQFPIAHIDGALRLTGHIVA